MVRTLENIPIHQLLEESLAVKSVIAERFGIILEICLENPVTSLRGDRGLLRAALDNLIDYAIKSSHKAGKGGKVMICQRTEGNVVAIRVMGAGDNGNRQVRGDCRGVRTETPAAGIASMARSYPGMLLARRVADLHGGRIDIELASGQDRGLTMYLPLNS